MFPVTTHQSVTAPLPVHLADEPLKLLYSDIDDALTTLHNATCLLHEMKQELAAFLDTYYEKVGKWFVTLELVKHHITSPLEKPAMLHTHGMTRQDALEDVTFSHIIQKDIKQLYRKAVKLCHPDSSRFGRQPSGKDLFRALRQAYVSGDFVALWWLLKQLPADVLSQEYLQQLVFFHERLNTHIDIAGKHLCTMQQSPAHLLKERIAAAERVGIDLIAEIISQVQDKIADAKRLHVQIKIREMASMRRELLACA